MLSARSPGETATEETDDNEASDDVVPRVDQRRPVPIPIERERPSRAADERDGEEAAADDTPEFKVYRDDDRRKTCGELDRELAQLQGQSMAPTDLPAAAETRPSTGVVSRLMDSSVVSGIRSTLTGQPTADEERETGIRQRIEWLRELKAEKNCYATQPLF